MKISKHYEENVIVYHTENKRGDYTAVKLGITIHSDKDLKSAEELEVYSGKLNQLARQTIGKELKQVEIQIREDIKKKKEETGLDFSS